MDGLDLTTRPNSPFRRRNSIATSVVLPAKFTPATNRHCAAAASFPNGISVAASSSSSLSSSSSSSSSQCFHAVDLDLLSINRVSYTSLKDLIRSTAIQSPTITAAAPGGKSGREMSICNGLANHAAWAYLRPLSTLSDSAGFHFLCRFWAKISDHLLNNYVASFLRVVVRTISRAFGQLIVAVRAWSII